MKKYFTTLEAAKMCQVSQGSMIRWIHEGKLQASVTPGGHHRIDAENLRRFLEKLRMPIPKFLELRNERFLLLSEKTPFNTALRRWIKQLYPASAIEEAHEAFTAGWKISSFSPDIIILNAESAVLTDLSICRHLRTLKEYEKIPFLITASSMSAALQKKSLLLGRCEWLLKPFDKNSFAVELKKIFDSGLEFKRTGS